MFNESEVYKLMKLRQEEVERKAQNAWKMKDFQRDTLFQKLVKNITSKRQLTTVKTNCECVCCC
jgi:poly-D-alanine transfer protein DltD